MFYETSKQASNFVLSCPPPGRASSVFHLSHLQIESPVSPPFHAKATPPVPSKLAGTPEARA